MTRIDEAPAVPQQPDRPVSHSVAEDMLAIAEAAVLFSLGVMLLKAAGLVTGSLSGLSLLISYWTGIRFGWVFAAINMPFLIFAFFVLGRAFAAKTAALCLIVPAMTLVAPRLMELGAVHPVVGAVGGAFLIGNGILIAARHSASAGGIGIVAIWMQKRGLMKAGSFQLGVDLIVLLLSILTLPLDRFLWSAAGMIVMNSVMIVWHRPDRYVVY
ncbi:MAG: YitT family protein [Sphingobium sp.]